MISSPARTRKNKKRKKSDSWKSSAQAAKTPARLAKRRAAAQAAIRTKIAPGLLRRSPTLIRNCKNAK